MPTDMSDKKKGAARHGGDLARRYEGQIPGGRSAEPHTDRDTDHDKRRKIAQMQHEVKDTDKIG